MADLTIYHNPRCGKSRKTLKIIQDKGYKPEIVLYLETPPSKVELFELIEKLGIDAVDLLRKGEDEYKALKKEKGEPTNAMAVEWMIKYPKLIERPIVVMDKKAVLGRPPENVLELI